MTRIYFPARTNVHYWDLEPLELDLDSRLKLSAILYDELIFDDGAYMVLIGPKLRTELRIPMMEQIPDGYFDDPLPREGGEFSIAFGDMMMASPAQRRYQLCFRKLLEDAGLAELPWVSFNDQEFNDKGKEAIKQLAKQDMEVLHDGDRDTYFLHSQILQSLNHDWVMGSLNGWDLNLDPLHEIYLKRKLTLLAEEVGTLNPPVDFEVVFPRLPDLTRVSWDQVLRVRDHPSAIAFRQSFASVSREARQAYLAGESADAIRYQVMKWRDDQLVEEIESRLATKRETISEIATSLVLVIGSVIPMVGPFIGAIDACRSIIGPVAEYTKDRQSLASAFVRRQRDRE